MGEPEGMKLALGGLEPLTEGHGVDVCVAQWVALMLYVPLPLRVTVVHADAVPR